MSATALQRVCTERPSHILMSNGPLDPRATNFTRCRVCDAPTTTREIEDRFSLARTGPNTATVVEPISVDAPASARPHCCYIRTIIFYEQPFRVVVPPKADGTVGQFAEHGRFEHHFTWNDVLEFDGERWHVGGGRVAHIPGLGWEFVSDLWRVR
jgi:hypothetical protein